MRSSSSCAPPTTTRRRRRSLPEAATATAEAVGRGHRVLVFTTRRIGAVVFVALCLCPVEIHAGTQNNDRRGCFVGTFSSSSSSHRRQWRRQRYEPRFLSSNFEAAAAASSPEDDHEQEGIGDGHGGNGGRRGAPTPPAPIRLNKVLTRTHSRRSADRLIQEGRVTVNGAVAALGAKVHPAIDEVKVDGLLVPLDQNNHDDNPQGKGQFLLDSIGSIAVEASSSSSLSSRTSSSQRHQYVKYWKPVGVTCTCDVRVPGNLVEALLSSQTEGRLGGSSYGRRRLFPVGRLDRDTSGLLLLTSDGRLPNAVLKATLGHPKTYQVTLDRPIDPVDVDRLQRGVVITTETSRPPPLRQAMEPNRRSSSATAPTYRRRAVTARTRPAQVGRDDPQHHPNRISVTVTEGRNRQVRKMVAAVGYTVVKLHRTSFLSIGLDGLEGPGDSAPLNEHEMGIIQGAIRLHQEAEESSRTGLQNDRERDSDAPRFQGGFPGP